MNTTTGIANGSIDKIIEKKGTDHPKIHIGIDKHRSTNINETKGNEKHTKC
jgi:hypothetical protein